MDTDLSFFANPKGAAESFKKIAGADPIPQASLEEILPLLLTELRHSPDPDMALANLERFTEVIFSRMAFFSSLKNNPAVTQTLITLFGQSQFLSDVVVRNPEYFDWFIDSAILKVSKTREELLQELKEMVGLFTTRESRLNAMRRFKRREMLRIGLRDMLKEADLAATTRELSFLADVTLEMAAQICDAELRAAHGAPVEKETGEEARFCVIAMGKLGGNELNYSSDIDVMFLYSHEGETNGASPLSNHEYFTKLCEQLIQVVSGMTREGYIFRLDARLRPEGLSGPLVRSLESYENYYGAYGETWERLALIKGRPCAGDPLLGKEFSEMIQPFIYQKYTGFGALEDLQKIKKRIEQQVAGKGTTFRNVKLGYGGIREIEFAVQMLQLLYGGKKPRLRGLGTLPVLEKLREEKFITPEEEKFLCEAYIFLRHVEHKLQIMHERQLHTLPEKPEELRRLALRLGFEDARAFSEHYEKLTQKVNALYARFFKIPDEKKRSKEVESLEWLYAEKADKKEVEKLLRPMGFLDPAAAWENLLLMARGPSYMRLSSKTKALFLELTPKVLEHAAQSPDPDKALNNLERFVNAQGARARFYELLAENPQALKLLLTLGGTSQFLSDKLAAHPSLFGALTVPGELDNKKGEKELAKLAAARLAEEKEWDGKMNALRRFKSEELLRIGLRDLLGLISIADFFAELTDLANVAVAAALNCAVKAASHEMKKAKPPKIAVIGMGKFGGAELAYSSDLDLLFVSGDGDFEFADQAAVRCMDFLSRITDEGFVFRTDARLRPHGEKGPLAPTLESYAQYYKKEMATWEKQSLTKARFVCGDADLGKKFMKLRDLVVYAAPLTAKEREEIFHMRERMEKERTHGRDAAREIKLGAGGIVDIEFATQLLQMQSGSVEKTVRVPGTLPALAALTKTGELTKKDFGIFDKGYRFLRTLENKLRIVSDLSLDMLPEDPAELEHCARRVGYHGKSDKTAAQQLTTDFAHHTHAVRETYLKLFAQK